MFFELANNRRHPAALGMLLFLLVFGNCVAAPLKIAIASDSTAANFPPSDAGHRWGWGQALPEYFTTNIIVTNLAASGRSSKSFYDEGKWANCLATHADYYFIQFGHNDDDPTATNTFTDPQTTFKGYLSNYVAQARAQGGIPVFLTPPTRRNYSSEHVVKMDTLQPYAQAMRELGAVMSVPVLDELPSSIDFFQFVGKTSAPFYQADKVGPPVLTNADTTHFSPAGARQHCYLIMDSLLTSTNSELTALQNEVQMKGILVQATLQSTGSLQFQGSYDLTNSWQSYGSSTQRPPATISRYLYILGPPKEFFRAKITQ